MTEADLARRIYDNLNWSLIVDSDGSAADGGPRMDVWSQLQLLWPESDGRFVEGLYLLLLSRPADAVGLGRFCAALAAGMSRVDLVRSIATSEEARIGGLNVSWLARLETSRPGHGRRFSLVAVKSLVGRVLRRVRKLGAPWATCTRAKDAAKGEL